MMAPLSLLFVHPTRHTALWFTLVSQDPAFDGCLAEIQSLSPFQYSSQWILEVFPNGDCLPGLRGGLGFGHVILPSLLIGQGFPARPTRIPPQF